MTHIYGIAILYGLVNLLLFGFAYIIFKMTCKSALPKKNLSFN